MKKKRMLGYWSEKIPYERVLRVMRLMFLLTVCIVCQLSAESLAQTVKLKEQTLKLKSIFEQVEAQTGKFTLFSNNELDMNRAVKLDRREFTLEELYRLLLRDTKLEFEITRDYVVIRPGREVARDSVRKLIQVSGVVRDERHNPLPGVTVLVKELKVGSATNVKGRYAVEVPLEQFTLVFSFIGMETKEIAYVGRDTINVVLKEEAAAIDEVVVNGLFTQNRNSYTGSVTTIKSEEIMRVSQTNLLQALAVLTPGMRILENNEQGSNPNYVPEIVIRGTSSISAKEQQGLNRPLIMWLSKSLNGLLINLLQQNVH